MPHQAVGKNELIAGVSKEVADNLKVMLKDIIQEQVSSAMMELIKEGSFYRDLSRDLNQEIKILTGAIQETKKELDQEQDHDDPDAPKPTDQLSAFIADTDQVASRISRGIEKLMSANEELLDSIDKTEMDSNSSVALQTKIGREQTILMEIMTDLNSQDITGQRLQKIVKLVQMIETKLNDYLVKVQASYEKKQEETSDSSYCLIDDFSNPVDSFGEDQVEGLMEDFGL